MTSMVLRTICSWADGCLTSQLLAAFLAELEDNGRQKILLSQLF